MDKKHKTMEDKYWAIYHQIKFSEYYYWYYRAQSETIDKIIKGALCITSSAGIASWFIWKQFAVVWAIVIALSQVVSAINHLFPFSRRVIAINFLLPELKILLCAIDHDWSRLNDLPPIEVNDLAYKYEQDFLALENKYTAGASFPRNKGCEEKAEMDNALFFEQRFDVIASRELEVSNP